VQKTETRKAREFWTFKTFAREKCVRQYKPVLCDMMMEVVLKKRRQYAPKVRVWK
jgi:hypothetical protein